MMNNPVVSYRRDIDGLRAIAVVSVIFFHAGNKIFSGGFVGVDIFFVISGYLITSILLREIEAGEFSIIRFYERRARRILPALFFVIASTLPLAWFVMLPGNLKSFGSSLIAVVAFASNIYFFREINYFGIAAEQHPLLHTWSLSVEEQYYFLFPVLLMFLWRLGRKVLFALIVAVVFASLALSEYGWRTHPQSNFFLLPTRAWELLIGSIIAFWHTRPSSDSEVDRNRLMLELMALTGLFLVFYSVVFFDKTIPFPSAYSLVPTIGTALILASRSEGTVSQSLLTFKPFVSIGLISYSAYLWHQVIFAVFRLHYLDQSKLALTIPFVFALSFLSYRYIEVPFRDRKKYSRNVIFSFSLIVLVLLAACGLYFRISNGAPQRIPEEYNNILSDREKNNKVSCHSRPDLFIPPKDACEMGDKNGNQTFALVGDSHADALAFEIDQIATEKKVRVLNLTYNSCPPFPSITFHQSSRKDLCNVYLKDLKNFIDTSDKIKSVILSTRITPFFNNLTRFDNTEGGVETGPLVQMPHVGDKDNASSSLEETYDELATAIKKDILWYLQKGRIVYLVYPVPEVGWDVPSRLVNKKISESTVSPEYLSTSYSLFMRRNRKVIEIYDSIKHENLVRVRPSEIFCDASTNRCLTHDTVAPYYYDHNHLSNHGAKYVVEKILE